MRSTLFIILVTFCFQAQPSVVEHKVQEDETAWFVSLIYYGDGARFSEILTFNHIDPASILKDGTVLKIENPKFAPSQSDFVARLEGLRKKREERRRNHARIEDQKTKVVIPSAKIRDSLESSLPFSEVKDSQQSLFEKAKEEFKEKFKVRTSNSEP
jgi:hypothetical protein